MLRVDYATLPLTGAEPDLDPLDAVERARAERFVDPAARRRFVVTRAALRRELAHRLGVPAHAVAFAHGAAGKPRLAPGFDASAITFSVSHSHELALLAFASGVEVGADVEYLRPLRHGHEIARRVLGQDLEGEALFRAWVRKEALVKCAGGSILAPLAPPPEHATADVPVPPGYAAAICAAAPALTLVERPLYSAR